MIEKEDSKICIEHEDGRKTEIKNLQQLRHYSESNSTTILATSSSKDLPH